MRSVRPFLDAMKHPKTGKVAIIAEIKLASPTEPSLGSAADVIPRSRAYEEAGADAISVVVEKRVFKGDISFVSRIKKAVSRPVLMKDFVINPLQIDEAKKAGADALLLIAKIVSKKTLCVFVDLLLAFGIEPVVEIDNEKDLSKALSTNTSIVAVNARDLSTFIVDVDRACRILRRVPKRFVRLGFSGISSKADVEKYKSAGVAGVLIGTSLMKTGRIKAFLEGVRL